MARPTPVPPPVISAFLSLRFMVPGRDAACRVSVCLCPNCMELRVGNGACPFSTAEQMFSINARPPNLTNPRTYIEYLTRRQNHTNATSHAQTYRSESLTPVLRHDDVWEARRSADRDGNGHTVRRRWHQFLRHSKYLSDWPLRGDDGQCARRET